MKTPCLECKHLAPVARIPPGDPREIQVGHLGMLARGLAYCGIKDAGQTYKRFRSLTDRDRCKRFERLDDEKRIESRKILAARLQAAYGLWIKERQNGRKK